MGLVRHDDRRAARPCCRTMRQWSPSRQTACRGPRSARASLWRGTVARRNRRVPARRRRCGRNAGRRTRTRRSSARSTCCDKRSRSRPRARNSRVRTVASGRSSAAATSSTLISSTARRMNTVRNASGRRSIDASSKCRSSARMRHALGLSVGVVVHRLLPRVVADRLDRAGVQRNHLRAAVAPQARQRFVDHDASQPGRQLGLATKAVDRAPGAQVGLLQRILGLGVALAGSRARCGTAAGCGAA